MSPWSLSGSYRVSRREGNGAFLHGEQPGFDYPYDNELAGVGKCYYTHDTFPVYPPGAQWQLTTSPFDLTGVQGATVSYALWFFVRKGHANDRFAVDIGNDTVGWTTLQTINTAELDTTLPGLEQRVRWVRQRLKLPTPTPHFTLGQKLRFTAS